MAVRWTVAALATGATLFALAAGLPSLAQTPPSDDGGWAGRPRDGEFRQRMEARRQQRESELRAALRLRPDQEPPFADYAAAARSLREGGAMTRGPEAPQPLPQRLEQMRTRLREQQAAFEAYAAAANRLYAVLDGAQRQTLDLFSARGAGRDRGRSSPED